MNSLNNLANQEVFRIAKEADPSGDRIVSIMTKLDLVQPGDEEAVSLTTSIGRVKLTKLRL